MARVLTFACTNRQRVPRSFASCVRRGGTGPLTAAKLRHLIPKRNLGPSNVHLHGPDFLQQIKPIAAPPPLLG